MPTAKEDHRPSELRTGPRSGAAREPSRSDRPPVPIPALPHPSAPSGGGNTVRSAALAALTLFTGICAVQSGLLHQDLIPEHMGMNPVEGWAFVAMTAGCYASVVFAAAASFFLWRRAHRKASLVALTGVVAFMASMIGLYFYVHAPFFQDAWLPFGIEHEPLEEAGTAAVSSEAITILAILLIMAVSAIQPKPLGGSKEPTDQAPEAAV